LLERIFARYPAAKDFDPCECGVTMAIVPRTSVQPDLHFVVDDDEFRAEASRLIEAHHLPNANYNYADLGVLILAERA
jgi:hypothetical protein